jgi:YfiH family protein
MTFKSMEPNKMSGNNMIKAERGGLVSFQFACLSGFPELSHQVFSRKGGLSRAPFDELNVAFSVGDNQEDVRGNRRLVANRVDCRYTVYANQVHGTDILIYSGKEPAAAAQAGSPRSGDALISDIPGLALAVQVADCQAILLYDPVRKVVANIHSGWRGSVDDIAGKTVAVMESRFGCRGKDMIAAIAPSLGPCCSEFINYRSEIPEKFWKYKDDGNCFDFWKISCDQLGNAGLRPDNIQAGGMCTRCSTDYFYSYRGAAGNTGRFATVIGLRPSAGK